MTQYTFKVGDRVAFSQQFLRNAGMFTGWAPDARGTIRALNRLGLDTVAAIQWDGTPSHGQVLTANLWPADKLHLEPS